MTDETVAYMGWSLSAQEQIDGFRREARELKAENAKLRELVRNLLRVIPRDVSGVVIGAHGEHPTYYSFDDAMRELGVEKKL